MATTKASLGDQAVDVLGGIGGADSIVSMTHCATRLRFELHDASLADKDRLEANPKVMGAVPQGGSHYQVIVGGVCGRDWGVGNCSGGGVFRGLETPHPDRGIECTALTDYDRRA